MQHLEVSSAIRHIYITLGDKVLKNSGQWEIRPRMTSCICHMTRIAATLNTRARVCVILFIDGTF
jgi:hypothetical protein